MVLQAKSVSHPNKNRKLVKYSLGSLAPLAYVIGYEKRNSVRVLSKIFLKGGHL